MPFLRRIFQENCGIMLVEKNMSKKQDYLKIRETFYSCRNFELTNLWQKSVLLTAFLVLSFTVYAGIVPKLFCKNLLQLKIVVINEICCAISLVGIIFSVVWIMMAKGSKAWYEVYESAIYEIEREKSIKIPNKYAMGERIGDRPVDGNIFTNNAGLYSPSKLNIFIGRVFMILWTIIFIVHAIFCIVYMTKIEQLLWLHCIIITLLFVFFLTIYVTAVCNAWGKSSYLEKN